MSLAAPDLSTLTGTLGEVLGDHQQLDPLYSVCKHGEAYGTRSATIIALPDAGPGQFLFAAGPPCTTPFLPIRWGTA